MDDSGLNGSEIFMLIAGGITMCGACVAMTYSFVLKSRCVRIKCCGIECDRSVVELTAADTELGHPRANFT